MSKVKADLDGAHWWLKCVWDMQRQEEGYRFLSYRDSGGQWHEVALGPGDEIKIPNKSKTVYFCPNRFSEPRRKKEFVLPSSWFYADLDETDPRTLDMLPPTMAWETSPGRYQAMWYLYDNKYPMVEGEKHRKINKRLNYYVDADKNGWSSSKALRVPGCVSVKHDRPFLVRGMWEDAQYYQLKPLWKKVKHVIVPVDSVMPTDL